MMQFASQFKMDLEKIIIALKESTEHKETHSNRVGFFMLFMNLKFVFIKLVNLDLVCFQ
jgi:hypothetical protein